MDNVKEAPVNIKSKPKRKKSKKKKPEVISTVVTTDNIEPEKVENKEEMDPTKPQKSREEIMAERKAKKAAKKAKPDVKNEPLQNTTGPPAAVTTPTTAKPPTSIIQESKTQQIKMTIEVKKEIEITKVTKEHEPVTQENHDKQEKSREEILRERELKKLAKQNAKQGKGKVDPSASTSQQHQPLQKSETDKEISEKLKQLHISEEPNAPVELPKDTTDASKPKPMTKAERRAIQEAQRAKKAQLLQEKSKQQQKPGENPNKSGSGSASQKPTKTNTPETKSTKSETPTAIVKSSVSIPLHKVKLFNHLYTEKITFDTPVNSEQIHPAIQRLGVQFAKGIIVGANARCVAFLNAMKEMINDYVTPPKKEFSRGLEELIKPSVAYLKKCRPLAVSMVNALRFIKWHLTQLNADDTDDAKKETLTEAIDTYIRDQIEKASQAISIFVQEKISNGDVILTYGCSSLIKHILEAAHGRKVDFRVVIVDAFPRREGHEMLKRLTAQGINCTCVLISAVGFIMPEVTKVLLGAHALLANGYVMSRVGTAQIALIAKSFNVPVLVCCETHKFSERVQTDAFVYNEIGDPNELVIGDQLASWESNHYLTPLNLYYDVTPPELVTAVVTEIAILPCTSVPVILRIKPSEIGY